MRDAGAEQGTSTDLDKTTDGKPDKSQAPGDVGPDGPHCGDNTKNGTEECDGKDLDGQTCASFGFAAGTLPCKSCSFDQSGCKKWKVVTAPTTEDLNDVWASSATDVWVVGKKGTVLRYDGSKWSNGLILQRKQKSWYPITSPTQQSLMDIWGSGPSDIWAVGYKGTIVHYNGGAWSTVASSTTEDLSAVWGTSATDVWAVGKKGTILHLE